MSLLKAWLEKLQRTIASKTQPKVSRQVSDSKVTEFRPKRQEERELEERVWVAQMEHRSKVLKERFAAQREWMAKYEEEEAKRKAKKEILQ